jgi:hypothetical protein
MESQVVLFFFFLAQASLGDNPPVYTSHIARIISMSLYLNQGRKPSQDLIIKFHLKYLSIWLNLFIFNIKKYTKFPRPARKWAFVLNWKAEDSVAQVSD